MKACALATLELLRWYVETFDELVAVDDADELARIYKDLAKLQTGPLAKLCGREQARERAALVVAAVEAVERCERAEAPADVEKARGYLSWPMRRLAENYGSESWRRTASNDEHWEATLDRLLSSKDVEAARVGEGDRGGGERSAAMEAVAVVMNRDRKTVERDCAALGKGKRFRTPEARTKSRRLKAAHDKAIGRLLARSRKAGGLHMQHGPTEES